MIVEFNFIHYFLTNIQKIRVKKKHFMNNLWKYLIHFDIIKIAVYHQNLWFIAIKTKFEDRTFQSSKKNN